MSQGFNLTWTIEGETQLARRLLILAEKVDDWTPAFQDTADTLKNIFSGSVFSSEGATIDERWAPLSKAYALRKMRRYPGKGLLEATGKMRNSFQSMFNSMEAAVWNSVSYFKYHQSNQPRSTMPRRVMMKLAEAQKQQLVKIFNTYFRKVVNP